MARNGKSGERSTTTRGGLRGLVDELAALHAAGDTAVLGIVVATGGSTYQKAGAMVLLDRHGLRHGVISGGCLEPELELHAQTVFETGRAKQIDFDTRSDEDLVFGSGTGCRGRVHMLLLPQPHDAPLTQTLRAMIERGEPMRLALTLTGPDAGAGVAVIGLNREDAASWNGSGVRAARPSGTEIELKIVPPPRLLLLGAGPETPPLLDIAHRFGWFVSVVEHRGRWSNFASGAERLLEIAPAGVAQQLENERIDAAVVMSHNYAIDLQHLRFCVRRSIGYVGLLGPPARRDALLAELGADVEHLHAPVGLDLGGSGPEAIALAIAAEVQRHFAHLRHA